MKKAEEDGRLGEAMVFSRVAKSVQPALDRYQNSLNGGYIPIPLNLEAMLHAEPEAPAIPTPKSVSQKGRDALASMAASSSSPGTTSIQMPDGSIVTRDLADGSWYVNGRGEMVQKGHEQDSLQTPLHDQQLPMPPNQETPEQVRLRWKSKWDARTGTARAIGHPAPDKTQQQHPTQTENLQQMHATSTMTSPQQAASSTMSSTPQMPPMNPIPENSREVGRSKRGWESSDRSMHDGEFSGWDVVHEEVMSQLNNYGLVGPACQRDAPPVNPESWWPGIDYGHCDPTVPVPEKARGSVEQWGLTAADKLPKLQEMGLGGNSYESLVRSALAGNRPLATYLAWVPSTFTSKYASQGPTSQGLDLAGFLAKIKFEAPLDSDGFQRRFVSRWMTWSSRYVGGRWIGEWF